MENRPLKNFKFSGFQSPNYTPVPDEIFDYLVDFLSYAELKVLLYVVRRTFGFKKLSDRISKSQLENGIVRRDGTILDRGVGLSRRAIRLAIDSLTEKKILLKKNFYSKEKGFEATEYALNILRNDPWVLSTQAMVHEVPKPLGIEVPIQETGIQEKDVNVVLVKHGRKEDDNNNDGFDPDANLIYQIIDYTGDNNPKSKGTFRKVIRGLGNGTTDQILAITKDAVRSGAVSKNKSAGYFIGVANNMAKDRGIDLGFKNGDQQRQVGVANLKAKIGNREAVSSMKIDRDDAD